MFVLIQCPLLLPELGWQSKLKNTKKQNEENRQIPVDWRNLFVYASRLFFK